MDGRAFWFIVETNIVYICRLNKVCMDMHKLLRILLLLVCLACAAACNNGEIDDIREQLKQHEAELQRLAALADSANGDITALQRAVGQMQSGGYVTAVIPDEQNGTTVGYTLVFGSGETIYLSTGKKATPTISVKSFNGGDYYWTIDGEWLLGIDGKMIAVENNQTPLFKLEDDTWFISLDKGQTWSATPQAASSSPFKKIDTSNPNFVLITLSDGTVLQLTTWSAHVALRNIVNQLNNNLAATRRIVEALSERDYLLSTTPLMEDSIQTGWVFTFAKSGTVVVYSAKSSDGEEGHIIKLEDGRWWISAGTDEPFVPLTPEPEGPSEPEEPDNPGEQEEPLGAFITGTDTSNPDFVLVTLSDDTTLEIPVYRPAFISIDLPEGGIFITLEETVTLDFSISGTLPEDAIVSAFSDGNFITSVSRTSPTSGSISILCIKEFEQGTITILLNNGNGYVQTAVVPVIYTVTTVPISTTESYGPFDTFEYANGIGGIIMPADGGTRGIKVKPGGFWASHNTVDWLSISASIEDNRIMLISVEPNPFREDRYLTIHFHGWGTVLVKQLGNPLADSHPNWGINHINMPSYGGNYTIFIHASEYRIEMVGECGSVNISKLIAENLWQVTFSVGPSEADGEKFGILRIHTPEETGEIYFTQIAKQCID